MSAEERRRITERLDAEGRQPTDHEAALILDSLRGEALRDLRALGCTCTPTFTLTEGGVGRFSLPLWATGHEDRCRLVIRARAAKQAATS